MGNVSVRNIPDKVLKMLQEEAARSRRSVNSVILLALDAYLEERQRRHNLHELIPELDALRERIRATGKMTSDSVDLIREDRLR